MELTINDWNNDRRLGYSSFLRRKNYLEMVKLAFTLVKKMGSYDIVWRRKSYG